MSQWKLKKYYVYYHGVQHASANVKQMVTYSLPPK